MENKAWIVAVNMGYGHQRTAYALKDLSANSVINANSYSGIPDKDKKIWESSRNFYEFISNFKRVPLIGRWLFSLFDKAQKILVYYPQRDMSRPNFGLKQIYSLINKGWGDNFIKTLSGNPLPLVSTFFVPAFMAEQHHYPNKIYCIVCDADIARSWAPLDPLESDIQYFAPSSWVRDRLRLYGVKPESIHLTGYPLPKQNVGEGAEIARKDLVNRLLNLDPKGEYYKRYKPVIETYAGELPKKSDHILTLMFAIGGAGAQKEIGAHILKSLKNNIKKKEIKFVIGIGARESLKEYYLKHIHRLRLEKEIDQGVELVSGNTVYEYFDNFNKRLRTVDILWTKPSELSFYTALGIPMIIAPPIGSQEDFNKRWLLHMGSGVLQENPKYTSEWLFDLLKGGVLAESAMEGFIEIEKMGTYNIEKIVLK